jgi:DNA primase large subunit
MKDLLSIPKYVNRAVSRVIRNIKNVPYRESTDEEVEVLSFHIGLVLSGLVGRWVLRKFIDSESKRMYELLIKEDEKIIELIANKLGMNLEYLGSENNKCGYGIVVGYDPKSGMDVIECYQFRLKIPHYLRGTEKLRTDLKWKLVNRIVRDGYVYINKRDAARIIEEYVKNYVIESLVNKGLGTEWIPSNEYLNNVLERIRKAVKDVRGFIEEEVKPQEEFEGPVFPEAFPPCMKAIIDSLSKGEHLTHHQRFAVATFLLNVGADVDYILDLFKNTPDFNERIAKYQIEHLAGLRGSRKKYLVYSCDKMKTLGICVADCGTKTPLQYYRKALRAKKGRRKSSRSQE